MSGYLSLPNSVGNFVSTPDSVALSITGSLGIQGRLALDDWTPTSEHNIIGKWTSSGSQRSFVFGVKTDGTLILYWSTDGSAASSEVSSVAPTVVNGAALWIYAALDVSNGDVKFYTGGSGSAPTWVQLGATQTGVATSIFDSTAVLEVGSINVGTSPRFLGGVYNVRIFSDTTGSTSVFDADFTGLTTAEIAAKSFTEDSSNAATVTLNGTAWRYIWSGGSGPGGPQRLASQGQMLRTGRAQN